LCTFWEVSRQAYYKGRPGIESKQANTGFLLSCVKDMRKTQSRPGTLKLRKELREEIKSCGRGYGKHKFFDLLRSNNLLLKRRCRYCVTTNSNHPFYKHTNQLAKATITAPDPSMGIRYYLFKNKRKICVLIPGYRCLQP
jgi:putative transposase